MYEGCTKCQQLRWLTRTYREILVKTELETKRQRSETRIPQLRICGPVGASYK